MNIKGIRNFRWSNAFGIALVYFLLGMMWIFFSDIILYQLAKWLDFSTTTTSFIGMIKGMGYVTATAILLYFLVRRRLRLLTRNRDDFKRFFRDSPNPMWIYDLTSKKILLANNAAVAQYGYSEKEFRHLDLYALRPESEHEKLRKNLSETYPKLASSGIWLHKRKDGSTFFAEIFSGRTEFQEMNCRLVTAIDVDKSYILQKERKFMQKALDSSASVSRLDSCGYILDVNDRFCATYGWNKDELIGQHISVMNSGEHDEKLWTEITDKLSGGLSCRYDLSNKNRSGQKIWMDTVITPMLDDFKKPFQYIAIQYNITERKHLEEAKSLLLTDFSNYSFQTSHQLRGPLSRLLGLVELYKQDDHREFILEEIGKTAAEIDEVIRKMNAALNRNSQEYVRKRFMEE
jgi:PAS domain S-box-containing protein